MGTAMATVTVTAARTTAEAMVGAAAYGGAGIAAGAAARRLLAGLRRGTRVHAPLCELTTGALWAVIGGLWGAGRLPSAWLPALLGLGWLGVAAGLVDVRHRRLPDTLTAPAACLAPLSLLPLGLVAVGRGLLGALVAVAGYGLVHLLRPTALGLGDVKLAAPLGAVLGAGSWAALAITAVLAAVLTGAVGLLLVCAGRAPPGAVVPHGPSMLAAAWLVTLATAAGGG
jgi:leader peptidase (prepilin peptidase)/N-methyltransferase